MAIFVGDSALPLPEYNQSLAARVCKAWNEDPRELESAIERILSSASQPAEEARSTATGKTPDLLQQQITQALSPPDGLESKRRPKTIEIISSLAENVCLLSGASMMPRSWDEQVQDLQERSGRKKFTQLQTAAEWRSFLGEAGAEAQESSPEQLPPAGTSVNRVHEAVQLLKSFAPVVARRAAARATIRSRLEAIFDSYAFDWKAPAMEARLTGILSQAASPPAAAKGSLRHYPRAFAGSFAAELATVVGYPPSGWMLERELQHIDRTAAARKKSLPLEPKSTAGGTGGGNGRSVVQDSRADQPPDNAWHKGLMGLCFSGGGIRSATFNLGILQGLAKRGLLPRFEYLSTVSGGGYIGSWLLSWIKRSNGIGEVTARLAPGIVPDPADKRFLPIEFLRKFSNYLTPKTGLTSADTWVMGVVWLRNTMLNLLVLLPTLFGVLFVPRLLEVWARWVSEHAYTPFRWTCALLAIAIWVTTLVALNLREQRRSTSGTPRWYGRPWWIRSLIVLPLFAAGWIVMLTLMTYMGSFDYWPYPAAGGFTVSLLALAFAGYPKGYEKVRGREAPTSFWAIVAMILIAAALSGVGVAMLYGMQKLVQQWPYDSATLTVWGVPLAALAAFLLIVLLVGLMGRNLETTGGIWLGRLKTYVAMYGVLWIVGVGISLFGACIWDWLWHLGRSWAKWPAIAAWGWTTLQSVLAGKQASTSSPKPGDWKTMQGFYLFVGPYIFIAGLMLALSTAAQQAFLGLESSFANLKPNPQGMFAAVTGFAAPLFNGHPWLLAALAGLVISLSAAWILSLCVDVNVFSMNTFYRTRLTRCYLGATNNKRRSAPFTGYDPDDDYYPLANFKNDGPNPESEYDGPYPIFNATLNLVHGDELAWQERKGASFIFTPDLCGYDTPWNAATDPRAFRNLQYVGYRPTEEYAYPPKGMHLATPMSISGAAVSPNMGFYSGAATAFLMTLFNVRLGWWLGNPRSLDHWREAGPWQGLAYLVKELLGLTDDRSGFVYLSDGGHFENLAIYELVRRRCRYIIACDAEEDESFSFQGLGNAIRKCREDFGVEIDIRLDRIKPDPTTRRSRAHCAVGRIYYPDQLGWGYLVYLKASLVGDEPQDVLEYGIKHPSFPHQSTADQWFTESQFESYRRLGLHIAKTAFRQDAQGTFGSVGHRNPYFTRVWERWYPPSDALEKNFTRHAAAYDALVRELRSDGELQALDIDLFNQQGQSPTGTRRTEKQFLFLMSLFQLMENVYLDLDLENNADHPDNAGWMAIFSKWTQTTSFREAWQRCSWTYGQNFQSFCNRLFGLQNNN